MSNPDSISVSHAFLPSQQTLAVQFGGAGQGSVSFPSRSGATTTCSKASGSCAATYDYGTTVTFAAPVPGTGSLFFKSSAGESSVSVTVSAK